MSAHQCVGQSMALYMEKPKIRINPDTGKIQHHSTRPAPPPPEGCMSNVLNVVVMSRNEEDYRGTVTYYEAKYKLFRKCLDLPSKFNLAKAPTSCLNSRNKLLLMI